MRKRWGFVGLALAASLLASTVFSMAANAAPALAPARTAQAPANFTIPKHIPAMIPLAAMPATSLPPLVVQALAKLPVAQRERTAQAYAAALRNPSGLRFDPMVGGFVPFGSAPSPDLQSGGGGGSGAEWSASLVWYGPVPVALVFEANQQWWDWAVGVGAPAASVIAATLCASNASICPFATIFAAAIVVAAGGMDYYSRYSCGGVGAGAWYWLPDPTATSFFCLTYG